MYDYIQYFNPKTDDATYRSKIRQLVPLLNELNKLPVEARSLSFLMVFLSYSSFYNEINFKQLYNDNIEFRMQSHEELETPQDFFDQFFNS